MHRIDVYQGDRLHAVGGRSTDGKAESLDGRRTHQVEGVRDPDRSREPPVPGLLPALSRARGTRARRRDCLCAPTPAVASAIVGLRTLDQLTGLDRAAELELDEQPCNG
jgi:hypothetical protein